MNGELMKELHISVREAGQRLDKFLEKYLKEASKSFIYKMLRKKNITLNGKKAEGSEKLAADDVIRIYFAQETLEKFTGTGNKIDEDIPPNKRCSADRNGVSADKPPRRGGVSGQAAWPYRKLDILYEDEHVCLINKPCGMLSQKAKPEDESLVEYFIGYLLRSGQITLQELERFRPSVCNRLDRNTSGIVAAGKTMVGLQQLGSLFRQKGEDPWEETLHKYYLALINGNLSESCDLQGYLRKDDKSNQVEILQEPEPGAQQIRTKYRPLEQLGKATLLEVELITGKSHQIRAHLASVGHPILGDFKYGDPKANALLREKYGLRYQLLHSWRLSLPELSGALEKLSGKSFTAPLPEKFSYILEDMRKNL